MVNVRSLAVLFSILILVFATGVSSIYAQDSLSCNQDTQFVTTDTNGKLICKDFSSVLIGALVSSAGGVCQGRLIIENSVLRCTIISIVDEGNRTFTDCPGESEFINSVEVGEGGNLRAGCEAVPNTSNFFTGNNLFVKNSDVEVPPTSGIGAQYGDVYASNDIVARGDLIGQQLCEGDNCVNVGELINIYHGQRHRISLSDSSFLSREIPDLGSSLAISNDGNTLYIGAATAIPGGRVYILEKSGNSWTGSELIHGIDLPSPNYFGSSLALSNDGNTLYVGDFIDGGKVYILEKSGNNWTGSILIPRNLFYFSYGAAGASLALSNDGNTLYVGDGEDGRSISVFIFEKSGNSWTGSELIHGIDLSGSTNNSSVSLALSNDGNTLYVGDDNGKIYILEKSGNSWTGSRLIHGTDRSGSIGFGASLALSNDGNTLYVGDINGKVYKLEKSGNSWTGSRLIHGIDLTSNTYKSSLALSNDENTLYVGDADYRGGKVFDIYLPLLSD